MVGTMLKVRLQRVGRRNNPAYRMVVIDSKKGPKSRNYIEMVGSYNPLQKTVDVKGDRVKHWMDQGAQVSDTVHNILVKQKVIEGSTVNPLPKKAPIVSEKEEEETTEAPAAEGEATEEASTEAPAEEARAEETTEEAPAEESKEEEKKEEAPAEEAVEETTEEEKEA